MFRGFLNLRDLSLLESVDDPSGDPFGILKYLCFPDPGHPPASFPQGCTLRAISSDVCGYFRDPVVGVRATGQQSLPSLPVPAVPEISVTEDRELFPWKDDVWFTWE